MEMDFHGMKRKDLQALCKKHGIPANLTNHDMADRLSSVLKEDEKALSTDNEVDSVIVTKMVKKVRFSPENETFIFVGTDAESDSDYDLKKKRTKRRKSTVGNNTTKRKKVEEENQARVTRSRAQSSSVVVVEDDLEKRVRRGKENVNKSRIESIGLQLRSRKILGTSEDNEVEKQAEPEKACSKGSLKKNEKSSALSEDLGKIGFRGSRITRARTRSNGYNNGFDNGSECGVDLEIQEEFQSVALQLVEPPKGLGKKGRAASEINAGKCMERGEVLKESRKRSKKMESQQVSEIELNVTSKKQSLQEGPSRRTRCSNRLLSLDEQLTTNQGDGMMSPMKEALAIANVAKPTTRCTQNPSRQVLLETPNKLGENAKDVGKYRRAKRRQEPVLNERSSVVAHEPVNEKPVRRSIRNTSKRNAVELKEPTSRNDEKNETLQESPVIDAGFTAPEAPESKTGPALYNNKEVAENSSGEMKEFRRKYALGSQFDTISVSAINEEATDVLLNLDSVVDITVQENESKMVEEDRENSFGKNIETDVGDHFYNSLSTNGDSDDGKSDEAAECPNKVTNEGSISLDDRFSHHQADSEGECSNPLDVNEGLETVESMLDSAVNEEATDVVLNLDSVVDITVKENESKIVEEDKEKSFGKNIETGVDDHFRNSPSTNGDLDNGKLVDAVECPNKVTSEGSISLDDGFSHHQADSEGECSNPVDVNEGLETVESMLGRRINHQSNGLNNQSVEGSKANYVLEDHQCLVELEPSGNLDPHQSHLSDASESQEPSNDAENWSQEAEKFCAVLLHDITKERVEKDRCGEIASSNTAALLPSTFVPESQDGFEVADETTFSRETSFNKGIGSEEALNIELPSVVEEVIRAGSEAKLQLDGNVLCDLGKIVNGKKNQEDLDECSDGVSHETNDEKAGRTSVTLSSDHEIEKDAFNSTVMSQFDTVPESAVNGEVDAVLNLHSVADIIIERKECNIVEEDGENLLDENIETDVDDHLGIMLSTNGDPGNGKSDELVGCSDKLTNVGSISSDDVFSAIHQADSEGKCSNPLDVNEGLETEEYMMDKGINLQSDRLDDQSIEDDKAANVQEDYQSLAEFDPSGNPDPVQDHLNDVNESQELVKDAPHGMEKEKAGENLYGIIVSNNTAVLLPSTLVPESEDEKATQSSVTVCRDQEIEKDAFRVGEPGSLPSFTSEKVQEERELGSAAYEVIKCGVVVSTEVADHMKDETTFENSKVPEAEDQTDETCTHEKGDCENTENGNKFDEGNHPEIKLYVDISCDSPEACSGVGLAKCERGEPLQSAEYLFQDAEKLCTVVPRDIEKEMLKESHYGEIASTNTSVTLPSTIMPESPDGIEVPDGTTFNRETSFSKGHCSDGMTTEPRKNKENESEGAFSNEHLSVIRGAIQEGSKGKLQSGGSVLWVVDKNDGQMDKKKNREVSDGSFDEVSPETNDEKAVHTSVADHEIEKDAFKDDREPGLLLHLTLENMQEEQERVSPSASKEMGSAAFEVTQTALPIDQPRFGELESCKDFTLDLTRSTSLAVNDAKVEGRIARMDNELDSKDNSERAKCDVVISEAASGNMDLVEGAEDTNDGEDSVIVNHDENIRVPEAEDDIDATCSNEKFDYKSIESANELDGENYPEIKFHDDLSCDSPVACSIIGLELNVSPSLGDENSGDRNDATEREVTAKDIGDSVITNSKSKVCGCIEDLSDATNDLNKENNVTTSQFAEELFNDNKDATEDAALCGMGSEYYAKLSREAPDSYAPGDKSIENDDVKDMAELSANFDNRDFQPYVHSSEFPTTEMNVSLRSGEDGDVKILHQFLEEANLESQIDEKDKEVEEDLVMAEEFGITSEMQLGEHVQHMNSVVLEGMISGDGESSNDQDDASAIIQEYMERETHVDEFIKIKDSYAPENDERRMTGVAEIEGYDCGGADVAERNTIDEPGIDNALRDSGEEDDYEIMGSKICSNNVDDGNKLADESPISPCKFVDGCQVDEKSSADIKLLADTTIGDTLTGNVSTAMDSPMQGNNALGTHQVVSGQRRIMSKEACRTDDDFLDLNNFFSSNSRNSSKITPKQIGEKFYLHNTESMEASFSASKDTEKGVQCSNISLVTASPSDGVHFKPEEKNTLEFIDELPLSTGFEVNFFSEDGKREEVEKPHERNLEDNAMSETSEEVKKGLDTVVTISQVSGEQCSHLENEMVSSVEKEVSISFEGSPREESQKADLLESISRSANPARNRNNNNVVPITPIGVQKLNAMKENIGSTKRDMTRNITAPQRSTRRPLGDLQKN